MTELTPELAPEPGVVLQRIYMGLPEHYRTADEVQGFPLYRWLAGLCRVASEVDELKERIDYVVPDDRLEPWTPPSAATNLSADPMSPGIYPNNVQWETLIGPIKNHPLGFTEGAIARVKTGVSGEGAIASIYNLDNLQDATAVRRLGAWVSCNVDATARFSDNVGFNYPTFALPADEWVWVMTPVAKAGHVSLTVNPVGRNALHSDEVYVSGTLATTSLDVTKYFDGNTAATNEVTYGWNGLPYASTSFRTPRPDDTSDLADPTTADPEWLPWMAQLVGVKLEPGFTESQARDAVRYASAGWRAGTKQAIADAAKSELTGTKYAAVYDHSISDVGNGGQWDVLIVTRPTETPDAATVLAAVVARGAKPAGVVLHHRAFESTWDTVTGENPTWDDYTETWDELQEAGF